MSENLIQVLESKVKDDTVIDAGHYGYLAGPSELDNYLFNLGVKVYSDSKSRFRNLGLMTIVDDMYGVTSGHQRKGFDINMLPETYLRTLEEFNISRPEVKVISQSRLRNRGHRLEKRNHEVLPPCELVAASSNVWRQQESYRNALLLYDELKTDAGLILLGGMIKAQDIFGVDLETHAFVFRNKGSNPSYFTNQPQFQ